MSGIPQRSSHWLMVVISALPFVFPSMARSQDNNVAEKFDRQEFIERFGEQQFFPKGGFLLSLEQELPELVWEHPELVSQVVDDITIPTRWFNERFEEVKTVDEPGRYYVYGEAPVPSGPVMRRAMTCYCLPPMGYGGPFGVKEFAKAYVKSTQDELSDEERDEQVAEVLQRWRSSEEGVLELYTFLKSVVVFGRPGPSSRPGHWQMKNATQHVRLKRKLMGLADQPLADVHVKPLEIRRSSGTTTGAFDRTRRSVLPQRSRPSTQVPRAKPGQFELRRGTPEQAGVSEELVQKLQSKLDEWYEASQTPMAVVVARNGVIIHSKGYGSIEGKPVTIHTPMRLDSAMKPLIGIQLAMFVDRGYIDLDEPIGKYLPEFDTPSDKNLTFRAAHVHATGIHFPWELAFSRLFYFHTWHESLIAHCKRDWEPGARHQYGVVGVILSVRAIELLRGMNYWDAMEQDLFRPLGIRDMLPGGRGFSAENMARIGVLLDNRGRFGGWRAFSEETCEKILPTSLKPYFPALDMKYGIGLRDCSHQLGPGSYGHGGGCGTQIVVNPEKHLVFSMVRNERGEKYNEYLSQVMKLLREEVGN